MSTFETRITYARSRANPSYWVIYLNGRAWRVMSALRDPRDVWPTARAEETQ